MVDAAYQTGVLRVDEAHVAYPLVNLEHSDVTLDRWRAFVQRADPGSRDRSGTMAVTDRRGTMHAVIAYRIADDLRFARSLRVGEILMGRLPGGTLPRAILACAGRLADELGSASVQIDVLEDALAPGDREALREVGFRSGGVHVSRMVPSRHDGFGSTAAAMPEPSPEARP